MTRTLLMIAWMCAALLWTGCGGLIQGKAASEAAIQRFHQTYNEGRPDDIWIEAHAKFRNATTKDKYDQLMSAIQRKLGVVTSSLNSTWKVNTQNFTTSVSMVQKTVFEKGEGTEVFTFEMDDNRAVLVGYNIQSMDLVTK